MATSAITPGMTHDAFADAIYIMLRDVPYGRGEELDSDRIVDYGADNEVRGIEFLNVSLGVDLTGVPRRDVVENLLRREGIRILGDPNKHMAERIG